MNRAHLVAALSSILPSKLAEDLVEEFILIRQDFSTKTLGRSSPGKFVETVVQCLQQLARGSYDAKPDVEGFLQRRVENETKLAEDLRVCAARIARSMYTLRNRRNIAHKGLVDPNSYDLAYLHHGASWLLAEFLRQSSGLTMEEAGSLIAQIHAPIDEIIEEIDGVTLVHADVSIEDEITLLLRSHYPDYVPLASIRSSLVSRNQGTLGNKLREMVSTKRIFGNPSTGYKLTLSGLKKAGDIGRRLTMAA